MKMNLNDYQKFVVTTFFHPKETAIVYPAMGLVGEAGEVANKVKKLIRRQKVATMTSEERLEIIKELGDVLWYTAALAYELGYDLQVVADYNMKKLIGRKERGTLEGDGDNR